MADDLLHPDDRPDPAARCRADLAGYLRDLSAPELADLLDGLPDPVTVDPIGALAARGPASARLPDDWPGHPDSEFMRRRSLREVVADRRAARAARRAGPPPGATLARPARQLAVCDPACAGSGGRAAARRGTPRSRGRAGRAGRADGDGLG